MSACSTFTEHVWKPGECKNCFKPKSLHCLAGSVGRKPPFEPRPPSSQQQHPAPAAAATAATAAAAATAPRANPNLMNNSQRAVTGGASRSGQIRPPVAKKPTIAVKPTMMLPSTSTGVELDCYLQCPTNVIEQGKATAFTVWNRNGINHKGPSAPSNNNEGESSTAEIEGYGQLSPRTPSGNNNSGLADVLKEIAGLGPSLSPTPLSGSKDLFWGRISSSYRRSLERGLPASSCLAMGSSSSGVAHKRVSLSDGNQIISMEGGRFCYPEFSSDDEDDEDESDEDDDTERDDDEEHESWDESDEELLAMEIRMRGQPRFANFRAATLSPVPFAAGKKWNTVPLRNRSLQRICAVDYDDSYDEILNGYPSMDNRVLLDIQGSGFLSNSESITSPESSSSQPEDSRTTSSSGSSAPFSPQNGLQSPLSSKVPISSPTCSKSPVTCTSVKTGLIQKELSPLKVTETHKAVLAIRLEDQDGREGMPMPQALPGQPVTISFSPTEEQAKPYRVVNLEKSLICKPYTVVDVSASMANKDEHVTDPAPKPKPLSKPSSPTVSGATPFSQPLSPTVAVSSPSHVMPTSPTSVVLSGNSRKKLASIRYQEVWTSSTSPRQKIPKVDHGLGGNSVLASPFQHYSHKSAPTSPISGLSSSRTVPVKSPNLSEIKFNSFNNAGMPPFPIIIRDEPAYARSSKNAVKVPIVINPSAYDNLAVYKSFLGLSGELAQPKGVGSRVASHTYEEIGSSESVQSASTEKTMSGRGTSERASLEETTASPELMASASNSQPRTTTDSSTVTSNLITSASGTCLSSMSLSSPTFHPVTANVFRTVPSASAPSHAFKAVGEASGNKDSPADCTATSEAALSHKEEASAVLQQIVASIQPPQSPPESPSQMTVDSEELYALPPDATKETLTRPKSLFSTPDGSLSKPAGDTPLKVLSKSQSASAAVPLASPRSEPSAPFPPPRSTSSPYHAANILQRHFGNWTKSSASSSPARPSEGDQTSPSEGRRVSTDSSKPKRWISFKSFFRRRKDDDEQRERAERDKDKGKLVGLDGTVIHILPPPPAEQHHWFSEAKPEDPSQKPTIIFTYKSDGGGATSGEEGELRIEEGRGDQLLATDESMEPQSSIPGRTPTPQLTGGDILGKNLSQVAVTGAQARELPGATYQPARVNVVQGEAEVQASGAAAGAGLAPASEGGAPPGDLDEDGAHSHYSNSTASSQCSATYSNLGQSRANMIPLKQPRHLKASNDTLASIDLDADLSTTKAAPSPPSPPPPLPKKVPRSCTEPSLGPGGALRPRAEAKPGGSSLSVANPLYELDSTWETASQSSSLSSEAQRAHHQAAADSLERPRQVGVATSPAPQPPPAAPAATAGRERRVFPSTESLGGRVRKPGRGAPPPPAAASKGQRQLPPGAAAAAALYRGFDSWDEVMGRIRGLHADTLRKLAGKCEDRFMAGQKEALRFGTDSWSHFRLTGGEPCCQAGDAVYYTASYAKDPLVSYAIKICRSRVKKSQQQQQFFHSLAVRQSLPLNFNIQQDCGHFLADVPARLLPWEEQEEEQQEEEEDEEEEKQQEQDEEKEQEEEEEVREAQTDSMAAGDGASTRKLEAVADGHMTGGGGCRLKSRVVVITREVPFQTVADFVRQGVARHAQNPELYERQVCLLLLQLCSGLEHMKPYHVTHCDLRLENLLLVHCQPGNPWSPDATVEPNNNDGVGGGDPAATAAAAANATCPARLIISNFAQAKQRSALAAAAAVASERDQWRLAPEIVAATQYRKCDEFQTGILIYEMLHRPNPFEEAPQLLEREYTWADLPPLPAASLYSQGLQRLARLLLTVNPSERISMAQARACLQCLLWGPREDLFQALGCGSAGGSCGSRSCSRSGGSGGSTGSCGGGGCREATLQNWLDLKRTLMMIKFAERSLDACCGVSLEDWLCCQYLAFATTDSLGRVVQLLQPQCQRPAQGAPTLNSLAHPTHGLQLSQSQPL